ncbi:UvrD-helicase domain-containing protein [Chitiniphilus eburneus]|nr:UvrD-helicase domain-containing protein [Chitiniphilus eburneus]
MHGESLEITPELSAILDWAVPPRGKRMPLLIEASAGTGKTTALVLLHEALVRRGQAVLTLTYSQKGHARWLELYRGRAGGDLAPQQAALLCNTLDEFAVRCLRDHSREKRWQAGSLGHAIVDDDRPLLAMRQAVARVNAYLPEAGLEPLRADDESLLLALDLIDNLKAGLTFAQPPFAGFDAELADDYELENLQFALERLGLPPWAFSLFNEYEKCRESLDFLCHGDAAYDLAYEPDAVAAGLRARGVEVVLLDEFHDTKAVHFEIVRAMARAGCAIAVVGDRGQDIFQWRGVTPFSAFDEFMQRWPQTRQLPLSLTYRFGNPLAKAVGGLLQRVNPACASLRCASGRRTAMKRLAVPRAALPGEVVRLIEGGLAAGAAGQDFAVIVPQGQAAFPVMRALQAAGVPYRCDRIAPLHESREARILRAALLLQGWAKPDSFGHLDCKALLQYAAGPSTGLDEDERAALGTLLAERVPGERAPRYIPDHVPMALQMLAERDGAEAVPCDAIALHDWLSRHRVRQWFAGAAPTAAAARASSQALNELVAWIVRDGATAFLAGLDTLATQFARGNVGFGSKVVLTSILHCKGNEWRNVILPEAPSAARLADADLQVVREQYVAMSRAREGLWLLEAT